MSWEHVPRSGRAPGGEAQFPSKAARTRTPNSVSRFARDGAEKPASSCPHSTLCRLGSASQSQPRRASRLQNSPEPNFRGQTHSAPGSSPLRQPGNDDDKPCNPGTQSAGGACFPPCPARKHHDGDEFQFRPSPGGSDRPKPPVSPHRIVPQDKNTCERKAG